VPFEQGEHIVTEYSHKYSITGFHELAERADLEPVRHWVDKHELFSIHYLRTR
jgi:L-histidine Nalpha-methyltransferase